MADEKVALSNDGPDHATLLSWAVGTLQEWFEGWTDPSLGVDFMQYKIVHTEYTDNGLKFRLEGGMGVPSPPDEYEVIVKLKRRKP